MDHDPFSTFWTRTGEATGGDPAPDETVDALAKAIADRLGRPVTFVDIPAEADRSFGEGTLVLSLRDDGTLPIEWMGRLAVFPVGTESSVLAAAADLPCGVAGLLTDELDLGESPEQVFAVAGVPSGRDLADEIVTAPDSASPRLRAMASLHARLHDVDLGRLGSVPALDFDGTLSAVPDELADEATWLRLNCPPLGSEVLCHGALDPHLVRVDADDPDRLVFRNWSRAVRADHTYDLAATLLRFWVAPFFAASRTERREALTDRDGIVNLYLGAYQAGTPVDTDRLDYWSAFHSLVGAAADLRDPGHLPDELAPALLKRFRKLTR